MQNGRFPNRSGMITVAFQGEAATCPKLSGLTLAVLWFAVLADQSRRTK